MNNVTGIFVAKAARVFVFGFVSVVTPVYLTILGYSALLVGIAIGAMIAGGAITNIVLVRYENRIGRKRFLELISFLMLLSGLLLSSTTSYWVILLACFIGNISTTGTEAGPFQSVEVAALPSLVSSKNRNRSFGVYNLIGYGAASIGAFAASAPSYFQSSLLVFRILYSLYGFVGLLLMLLYRGNNGLNATSDGPFQNKGELSPAAKREITKISALFSIDAFGGGFVSQSLLALWFLKVYAVSLNDLGIIFLIVNVVTALSTLGSTLLAERLGNLRTMVYTHAASSAFLILIPFAGSLTGALFLLFARQSISQMDVPTRQAFMAGIFPEVERVPAFGTTNTIRIISSVPGAPISGALLGAGFASAPLWIAGSSKILYDGLIFSSYRKVVS